MRRNGLKDGPTDPAPRVPGAYPYTTIDTDTEIAVDSSSARTIHLGDGTSVVRLVVIDAGDLAGTNAITVNLANAGKKLNGTTNGSVSITSNGAIRAFERDASGNWRGGV